MLDKDNWQRNLNKRDFLSLIILVFFLFIYLEYVLFSRLLAERYFDKGLDCLEKSRSTPGEMLDKKCSSYRNVLKLLKKSIKLNPYDSRAYFEYANVVTKIGDDPKLSVLLDVDSFVDSQRQQGLYNLAKVKYIEAILNEPTNAIYHQRLGSIYDKLSDFKKAEEEFKKAVLLDPQNISICIYLSQYFLSKGRQDEFFYHLDRVLEIYKKALRGGGPSVDMVEDFLKATGRENLINK
jgi:tetratricopeptide (TPR) repeat protein